jgi:hypothetical protein
VGGILIYLLKTQSIELDGIPKYCRISLINTTAEKDITGGSKPPFTGGF